MVRAGIQGKPKKAPDDKCIRHAAPQYGRLHVQCGWKYMRSAAYPPRYGGGLRPSAAFFQAGPAWQMHAPPQHSPKNGVGAGVMKKCFQRTRRISAPMPGPQPQPLMPAGGCAHCGAGAAPGPAGGVHRAAARSAPAASRTGAGLHGAAPPLPLRPIAPGAGTCQIAPMACQPGGPPVAPWEIRP